jgi:hypothetical protein
MPASKLKCGHITALYRAKLYSGIGKKACEGKGVPSGISQDNWIHYNLFCALDEIATHLEEKDK